MYNLVKEVQLDPNGLCNSKCWFCPVAYVPNPPAGKKNMSIEMFEDIINQLIGGKGDWVHPRFNGIWTAHYNEVLMYPYFEEMLEILEKNRLGTVILTNGTPMSKAKIDIMSKYPVAVRGICLNIPSAEAGSWSQLTGFPQTAHEKMLDNIDYLMSKMPDQVERKQISLQVNGVNIHSLTESGGWLDLMEDAPEFDLDPETGFLRTQTELFRERFPRLQVFEMSSLVDRAGYLDRYRVITNERAIETKLSSQGSRVVGCRNGYEVGGRPYGWLHINANGDLFICCNDYDFSTTYGNVNDKPLKELYLSGAHLDMIKHSFNTMCKSCASAIWSD